MKTHCNRCSKQLHPAYLFCPYCGCEAPKKTIVNTVKEEKIDNPAYCPHCQRENIQTALFCSICGKKIYDRPEGKFQYCPYCGEKNRNSAKHCLSCGKNFDHWYNMQAEVADKIGYSGDLTLYEKMTETFYTFYTREKISVGRSEDNDITIPCQWVSGKHCIFDISEQQFIDLNSANGTYINRSDKSIKNVTFSQTGEFNLASVFTFTVIKTKHLFIFRLTAVLDEKECEKVSNINKIDELRNYYFILINGNDELYIRKLDGKIIKDPEDINDCYILKVKNKNYYFSEMSKNIENQLILKDNDSLPINWQINKFDIREEE